MFGCILENTIENTFSTYCSHFLTFSQLPNKYIISFLSPQSQKNKTQRKKIIKSGQKAKACGSGVGSKACGFEGEGNGEGA